MMMKLYNFHASSTSYRTRIVLNLKGLAYAYIPIRLDKAEHLSAAYGAINPMRGLPTLETDEGDRLYQSSAIIEYLEEVYPEPALLPKDAVARAHVRAIAGIVGADMHPVNNLRVRNFIRDTYKQDADGVAAWIRLWNKAGFEAIETMLRADADRRGFCYGEAPTIADAYLVSHVFSAVRFKTDMTPYPEIQSVVQNCTALKPFADAHPSKQPDA
jgi:maleylpyruvate isomerase